MYRCEDISRIATGPGAAAGREETDASSIGQRYNYQNKGIKITSKKPGCWFTPVNGSGDIDCG
jgi:hypothetical protein